MATRTCRNTQTLQNVLLLLCILCALCGICNGFSETDGKIQWDPFPTEPDYQAGRLHLHKTFKDINKAAVAFIHAIPPTELPWGKYPFLRMYNVLNKCLIAIIGFIKVCFKF